MTSSVGPSATAGHAPRPQTPAVAPLITPAWQMLAEQILHLAQFGSSVQVICAAPRAGKTTFLQFLREQAGETDFHEVVVAQGAPSGQLFRDTLSQLGLRPGDAAKPGEMIAALRSFAQSLSSSQRRVIIALDDAHRLQPSELAALVSVLQGGDGEGFGLHFLLVAEPGLAERIDELQLLDVAVHDVYLPAFSPGEIKTLLEATARANGEVLQLDATALQSLWAESEGLPGRALALMHEYVVEVPETVDEPTETPRARASRPWPYLHLAAVLLLCCVLIWAIIVRDDGDQDLEDAEAVRAPMVTNGRLSLPVTVEAPTEESAPLEPVNPIPSASQTEPAVEPVPASPPGQQSATAVEAPVAQEQSAPAPPLVAVPPPATQPAVAPAPAPTRPAETVPAGEQTLLRTGETRLLNYSPDGYVLQLMATGSLSTLAQFHAAQPNRDDLLIHRGEREGKVLYFLVEGFYADADSARAAVLNLPAHQKAGGPWPKKVARVQAEIRQLERN